MIWRHCKISNIWYLLPRVIDSNLLTLSIIIPIPEINVIHKCVRVWKIPWFLISFECFLNMREIYKENLHVSKVVGKYTEILQITEVYSRDYFLMVFAIKWLSYSREHTFWNNFHTSTDILQSYFFLGDLYFGKYPKIKINTTQRNVKGSFRVT